MYAAVHVSTVAVVKEEVEDKESGNENNQRDINFIDFFFEHIDFQILKNNYILHTE